MRILTAALLVLFATFAAPADGESARIQPARQEANGRYLNLDGERTPPGLDVTVPFFLRRIGGAFVSRDGAPKVVENNGAWLRENSAKGVTAQPSVTWIGHATFLVQMEGLTFLTDPTWSRTASPVRFLGPRRYVAPGLRIEDLPEIDFVVISHNHYDHLDLKSLQSLSKRNAATRFYVPIGDAERLADAGVSNVKEFNWGDEVLHGATRVVFLPAQHWSQRGIADARRALWGSWAVLGEGRRFYFAGDSGVFSGFAEIGQIHGPFDLAAVPIGAYEPAAMMRPVHLDPEEAVAAGQEVGASRLVGMHYGTFDLTDEPLAEPPQRFRAAGAAAGYSPEDIWILDVGETRDF